MVMTPVGPFCPFHSEATLDSLTQKQDETRHDDLDQLKEAREIMMEIPFGRTPDKENLLKAAKQLEAAAAEMDSILRPKKSDFQTTEYAKFFEAILNKDGVKPDELVFLLEWQIGCLLALANNTPPPMLPANIDLQKLMGGKQDRESMPTMSKLLAVQWVESKPFSGDEAIFDTPLVRDEYERLYHDHRKLIQLGSSYSSFDAKKKIQFLDQIEKIEDRWDIFFARFSLAGQLNPTYQESWNKVLSTVGMSEQDYKDILKKAHELMREEAGEGLQP